MKTGRNDPCPCGSGRKYKQCCLLREGEAHAAPKRDRGPGMALSWLDQRFRRQTVTAIDGGYFAAFAPEQVRDALARLGPEYHEMLQINIADYLLSEAIYERDEESGRGIDWVLEAGPALRPEQREFLEALADAPLRLYEVMSVRHGEGLALRDMLDPARSPPFVTEHTASTTLRPGSMLGARILRLPGKSEIGGAVYPLDRVVAAALIEHVRDEREGELEDPADGDDDADAPPMDLPPELAAAFARELDREDTPEALEGDAAIAAEIEDELLAAQIRDAWLQSLLFPQIPELVDRASGAPVLLIEDDYVVRDAAALAAALQACPDVVGDAEAGWSRLDDPRAEVARPLTTINPGDRPGSVTLFHQTQARAEAGREWFERVAGPAVVRGERRTIDPLAQLRNPSTNAPRTDPGPSIPPAELHRVIELAIRRTYANWCDEPIPALGGKTPSQCLATRRGRESVRQLLRTYEFDEARRAEAESREPVSYGFLWEALGLVRDD